MGDDGERQPAKVRVGGGLGERWNTQESRKCLLIVMGVLMVDHHLDRLCLSERERCARGELGDLFPALTEQHSGWLINPQINNRTPFTAHDKQHRQLV